MKKNDITPKGFLPQATLASGSCFKCASRMASLIWSHILSKRKKKENKKKYNGICIAGYF